MVEVMSNLGITVYGVIRWLGVPGGKTDEWAGIELVSSYIFVRVKLSLAFCILITTHLFYLSMFQDYEVNGCSDGEYGSQRYFTCKRQCALFVPVTKCSRDSRFFCSSEGRETLKPPEIPPG